MFYSFVAQSLNLSKSGRRRRERNGTATRAAPPPTREHGPRQKRLHKLLSNSYADSSDAHPKYKMILWTSGIMQFVLFALHTEVAKSVLRAKCSVLSAPLLFFLNRAIQKKLLSRHDPRSPVHLEKCNGAANRTSRAERIASGGMLVARSRVALSSTLVERFDIEPFPDFSAK